ncbi:hypothetical protein DUI87_15398 [Hirundo rustica rustica]|uniref:USP domain-containing protein n=1 Tax=Hirundo rustica rustica TaxID=333673 RepID=A0A3M0KL39_HIRRU|nr:hypothetical protein DUI87_15398 [Hirundo rustica rustica]
MESVGCLWCPGVAGAMVEVKEVKLDVSVEGDVCPVVFFFPPFGQRDTGDIELGLLVSASPFRGDAGLKLVWILSALGWGGKRRKSSPKPLVLSEAKKQLLIYRLPQVLRLHLKCFRRSQRNHREKIGVRVLFEQVLNMEPYCCRDSLPSLATETFVCDLSAVAMHHGKGFGSGHYTAYCCNTEGGFWVHCNDSKLNVCSVEEVCKTQAYILFHTQRTLQDKAGIPEKQLQAQVFATQNQ